MHLRIGCALAFLLSAATLPAAPAITASASARLLHDTNLFLQHAGPLATGQTQPGVAPDESATAVDAAATLVATWKTAPQTMLEIGYSPEAFRYFNHTAENHTDHAVTLGATSAVDAWTTELKARYLHIDGSDESPVYNGIGGGPAIGGEPVRARRAQAIGRASGRVTRQLTRGFVRGVFSVYDQQFHTRERTDYGYCNYADRDESSIGLDAGWLAGDRTSLVAGVRSGFQRQANTLGVPLNFSNTFTRWLAGVEGSPTGTLKLALLAGPTLHHYGNSVRPGFERRQATGYGEFSSTWTPTSRDTVAASARRYLWVPGGGRGIYADLLVDTSWRRRLRPDCSVVIGANYHEGDTGHFNPWAPRHDRIYTGSCGVSCTVAPKARVDVDVMHDWGVSLVGNTPGREYARWIGSVSLARTW